MKNKKTKKISKKESIQLNYRACKILNKQSPHFFQSIFIHSIMSMITPYLNIYFSARIINELSTARDKSQLLKLVLITISLNAIWGLINSLLNCWKEYNNNTFWYKKNQIYTDKLLHLDYDKIAQEHTYEVLSQIKQNQNWSNWGLPRCISFFEQMIKSLTGIAGAIILTVSLFTIRVPSTCKELVFLNHPMIFIGIITIMLIATICSPICKNKANSYFAKYSKEATFGNRFFGFFGYLGRIAERSLDIRMYNQQNICLSYIKKYPSFTPGTRIAQYGKGAMGLLNALSSIITTLFTGMIYVYVCLKAWAGAFGIGSITQYISSVTALSRNIQTLLETFGDMYNNAYYLRIDFEFLDIPNEMYQGCLTTEKRSDRNYEIEFCDVSFRYPNTENYSLEHVSMKFKIGSRLAIVGMNGSGKTTFIKLLCRLYDPTEGVILLNGIDIRKYAYDDYLQLFSVVFQDFKLLALPIGQNLATSKEFDRKKALDCLTKAGFTIDPNKMTQGLDTYLYKDLDKNGVTVSGGEAQKIAIARTLYKDAPFIILDEPTAALDPIAEAEIYTKLNDIIQDKTAVYISHRLSSCRFCDDIAVFHEGHLVQQGDHETLVSDMDGQYYKLWNAQAQYYN